MNAAAYAGTDPDSDRAGRTDEDDLHVAPDVAGPSGTGEPTTGGGEDAAVKGEGATGGGR